MSKFQKELTKFLNEYPDEDKVSKLEAATELMKVILAFTEADAGLFMIDKGGKILSLIEGDNHSLSSRRLKVTLEIMQKNLQEIIDHTDSSSEEHLEHNKAYVRNDDGQFEEDNTLLP